MKLYIQLELDNDNGEERSLAQEFVSIILRVCDAQEIQYKYLAASCSSPAMISGTGTVEK